MKYAPPFRTANALLLLACISSVFALDWEVSDGYRSAPLEVSSLGKTGFTPLAPDRTGITFTNFLPEQRHLTNQILLNGSGVAAGDIDGDGWCDLYFCRMDGPNALYRNLGNWEYEEITEAAGVGCAELTSTGAVFVDLDGDGDLDLVVNSLGQGTLIFLNDGTGRFTRLPLVLNPGGGGMSLALGDMDGDGFPDLYIANYRTSALMDDPNARATFKTSGGVMAVDTFNGRPVATDPRLRNRFRIGPRGNLEEQGEPDAFYRNRGGTNFTLIPFDGGGFLDESGRPLTEPPFDWGLSVMIRDATGNGLPDIYVCNDFQTPDRFWINQGEGRFQLAPRLALRKSSLFSMAADFADINRNGHDDLFVVDMLSRSHSRRLRDAPDGAPPIPVSGQFEDRPQYGFNTLFLNRGDNTYAEISQLSGLDASEWSWSCIFLDVDLDGWEDVLITNGMERAARDLDVEQRLKTMRAVRPMTAAEIFQARRMFPRLATPNLAFRNRGDLTFEEIGQSWGFDTAGVSHGMALADLDNDGDLDVIINNLNAPAGIYRNDSAQPRVAVRLRGVAPNTAGIGSRIQVRGGPVPMQSQEIISGGRYLSSDDAVRVFAAGSETNQLEIEVRWRSGRRSIIPAARANRIYEVNEAEAEAAPEPDPEEVLALFEDVSRRLGQTHQETDYDDFACQPLLPGKISQGGPGLAWFDVDDDGWDDLIIGASKGNAMAVMVNDGKGGFNRSNHPGFNRVMTRDQTGLAAWRTSTNAMLLSGLSNYQDGLALGALVRAWDLKAGTVKDLLSASASAPGPLALGDVNGNGELDLFVGGRVIPGRYPEGASSRLFLNVGGQFVLDEANSAVLEKIGLVSGAVFTDIDGDGDLDLVLACEWGPVRVLINENGKLSDATEQWGLSRYAGWWNGVAAGDFNADGRMDLVASNWGRNTEYEKNRSRPLEIYYGDFGEGLFGLIEAHYDGELNQVVPRRRLDAVSRALPFVRARFSTHQAYSVADVEMVLGDRFNRARVLRANWLESTVFLNRGDHFEARPLPVEAQFAPAFGIGIADFDGDGHEDIALAQNFFAVAPGMPRYDAGRALLLMGDGRGGFRAMSGQESGLMVYGEQRGMAVADYDQDGRVDLVIAQNGAETKLYRNRGGRPGLRARLEGPPPNRDGVGAMMRLIFPSRSGPAREVQAGSGYWSRDSAVQVLGTPEAPVQIEVRWPGGRTMRRDIPEGAREIVVRHD